MSESARDVVAKAHQDPQEGARLILEKAKEALHTPLLDTHDGIGMTLAMLKPQDWKAVADEMLKPQSDRTLPVAHVKSLGMLTCIEFTPGPDDPVKSAAHGGPFCSGAESLYKK